MFQITKITVRSFKRFSEYSVSCRAHNVLVGPNNAGKSTILDVIRLVSACHNHASRNLPTLASTTGSNVAAWYTMPITAIPIAIENVVHNYGEEYAEIDVDFDAEHAFCIRLHPDVAPKFFLKSPTLVRKTADYKKRFPLNVVVVPPLSAFDGVEKVVSDNTVVKNLNSRRASRNFRNILLQLNDDELRSLNDLIEHGFPGFTVNRPVIRYGVKPVVEMYFEERRVPIEISYAGFGFQVWLQMMYHISRGATGSILVLDEPDVYLHPHLQRKLLAVVEERFGQYFVATHSPEIVNSALPRSVVDIDARKKSAVRPNSAAGLQRTLAYVGSSENAQFAHLVRCERVIFFEGQDRNFLSRLARSVGDFKFLLDPRTRFLESGGFEQWRRVKEVDWAFDKVFRLEKKTFALFDRDYRTDEDIAEFLNRSWGKSLRVRVLERKEIENYAVSASSLIDVIVGVAQSRSVTISEFEAEYLIERVFSDLEGNTRSNTLGSAISAAGKWKKGEDPSTTVRKASEQFDANWATWEGRLNVVSGKAFVKQLSIVAQEMYGFHFSTFDLLKRLPSSEVARDLRETLNEVEGFFEGTV